MKKLFLIFALCVVASFAAADKNGALGLWVQGGNDGEWWGMDYKHLGTSNVTDIYFHLEAYNNHFSAGIYGGYYSLNNAIKADASMGRFPIHYGPTIGIGYWNEGDGPGEDVGFAVRVGATGGISWLFPTSMPMDVSIELNPVAEYHIVSTKGVDAKFHSNSSESGLYIPMLYFRLMFHMYIF